MIHLTLTGLYAGVPICGTTRTLAEKDGGAFEHVPSFARAFTIKDSVCKGCMDEYVESSKDDNGEWYEDTPQWVKEWKGT